MKDQTHTPKLAYSIRESCTASTLGKTKIYSLIAKGQLKAVRVGGRTVIPADSLHTLINGHKDKLRSKLAKLVNPEEETEEHIVEPSKELTVDAIRDWATACGLVERAVNTEAERILREGNLSPEALLKSETLRAAWIRIKQG